MSNNSRIAQVAINSLQIVIDHVNDDSCSPTTLLAMFDFSLLKHREVSIRKAALLSIFVLIKASTDIRDHRYSSILLRAPLVLKDGLIHLAIDSWDAGHSAFHDSIVATTKLHPGFLGNNLFGYYEINSISGLVQGVEALNKGKRLVLTKCLDYLPDPDTCRIFCTVTSYWQTAVVLEYMRIGGFQLELALCSSIKSSDSESCLSLDSLVDDLVNKTMNQREHLASPRKKSAQFKQGNLSVAEVVQKKFETIGHFGKCTEKDFQDEIVDEGEPEKIGGAPQLINEKSMSIIRQKYSSLGICKIIQSIKNDPAENISEESKSIKYITGNPHHSTKSILDKRHENCNYLHSYSPKTTTTTTATVLIKNHKSKFALKHLNLFPRDTANTSSKKQFENYRY